ncbi:MAG: hypothetical protein D8M58_03440 [Calditrichaeota bacterium]|nr:MAG: hypothetical protein DWQ03_03635 [Calditrichota bacterium]MBL1204420.1 hypothetical protein [Calditrichota bacterium]NOG44249.1 hypothetical protein [Calditrichota bacterium]
MEIQGRIHSIADLHSSSQTQHIETQNNQNQLSPEEQEKVADLKQRDQEVRRHEQAHVSAGGGLTSSPKYEFETGPDGRQYAVEGSVEIDTSKEADPEKTVKKAKQIQEAALAPADPSSEDRSVASKARQMEQDAQREIQETKQKENRIYNQSGTGDNLADIQSTISLIA